jgi:hypothetical protein
MDKLNEKEAHHVERCAGSDNASDFEKVIKKRDEIFQKIGRAPCPRCSAIYEKLGNAPKKRGRPKKKADKE